MFLKFTSKKLLLLLVLSVFSFSAFGDKGEKCERTFSDRLKNSVRSAVTRVSSAVGRVLPSRENLRRISGAIRGAVANTQTEEELKRDSIKKKISLLNTSISDYFNFNTRLKNLLLKANVLYLIDLIQISRKELLNIQGIGDRLADVVEETLSADNLHLDMKSDTIVLFLNIRIRDYLFVEEGMEKLEFIDGDRPSEGMLPDRSNIVYRDELANWRDFIGATNTTDDPKVIRPPENKTVEHETDAMETAEVIDFYQFKRERIREQLEEHERKLESAEDVREYLQYQAEARQGKPRMMSYEEARNHVQKNIRLPIEYRIYVELLRILEIFQEQGIFFIKDIFRLTKQELLELPGMTERRVLIIGTALSLKLSVLVNSDP